MNYEKAYKAVLKTATQWIEDGCSDKEKICLEAIFPELKESEDERIKKELIEFLQSFGETDEWIAWLEKQKDLFESGRGLYYYDGEKTIYCGYPAMEENPKSADSIPSDCTSDAKCGDRWHKVADFLPDSGRDVLAKDALGNCLLASFDGDQWSVSVYDGEDKPIVYTPSIKEWCDIPSEKQKEQKPAENEKVEMAEFEQSIYDLCPVLGIEEAKATASDLLELAKKTLLKTGKVVLASNYPEGCSFEDGFHLGYNEGFNAKKEQKPVELNGNETSIAVKNPEVYKIGFEDGEAYARKEQKPEWSEADEVYWEDALWCVDKAEKSCKDEEDKGACWSAKRWLKSLRSRPKSSDNWKPTEEQMDALLNIEGDLRAFGYNDKAKILAQLYEQLKAIREEEL